MSILDTVIRAVENLPTPCYIVSETLLEKNLQKLSFVEQQADCKILLAQKAFSMFYFYPLIGKYLAGTTASGLYEAKLADEYMHGENHIFSPAYKESNFTEITALCKHIVFNSLAQWQKFGKKALAAGCECGLRINPSFSTQNHAIYDPCTPGSRLGITAAQLTGKSLTGISGLHFHTLCEQGADALAKTLEIIERDFSEYLHEVKWLNMGGGHLITKPDYDVDLLIDLINKLRKKYALTIYLEPGEAVAVDAGFLSASVLDIVENSGVRTAILDTSAACHMPDVIEMPYRPEIIGAGRKGEKKYTYTLGGSTCLAGDIIGIYSFDEPLSCGQKLIFRDMAIYSMVKNNTFNGMPLPSIAAMQKDGQVKIIKSFAYEDFKNRLS